MNRFAFLTACAVIPMLLMVSCSAPITEKTMLQVDRDITLSMVNESPEAMIGKQLLLGGSIVSIDSKEELTELEIQEWHLNSWGEPLYVNDAGLKFLVTTTDKLAQIDEVGRLVTLVASVTGKKTRIEDGVEHTYPTFNLAEIHLWESPLRYGIHRNQDPGYPVYSDSPDAWEQNPYDPGYTDYPYSPYWLRRLTH